MSSTDASGGDELSALSGFMFYVFIVHPATAWILKPGRFPRQKAIMYAISFLAALAAIKTGERLFQCTFILLLICFMMLTTSSCSI